MKQNLLSIILFFILATIVSCDTSEQDFEKAKTQNTLDAYSVFVCQHPNSEMADEARDSVIAYYSRKRLKGIPSTHPDAKISDKLRKMVEHRVDSLYQLAEQENTISSWRSYANTVPQEYIRDADERRTQLVDEAYQQAEKANTISGWRAFIDSVPYMESRDAMSRLKELEDQEAWSTDYKAWQTATFRGDLSSMKKYLELYPKGKYVRQAEKKLIDIEVSAVFAKEHGVLPQMDKGYSTGTSYSEIEIENRTEYDLTVSYSGPDSKRMIISPHGIRSMRIGNGYYRVAATVGHGVRPFAGEENLDGSHFSSSFYIETHKF